MKNASKLTVFILLGICLSNLHCLAQRWERVGEDNTPGDSRVPLCILEKDGYIFFGDDHVGVFRYDEPSDTWTNHPNPFGDFTEIRYNLVE